MSEGQTPGSSGAPGADGGKGALEEDKGQRGRPGRPGRALRLKKGEPSVGSRPGGEARSVYWAGRGDLWGSWWEQIWEVGEAGQAGEAEP